MAKKKKEKLNTLIFIDTNIFLNFYRSQNHVVLNRHLRLIEKHIDSIITSSQVEMEFKKNRQQIILKSISDLKKNSETNISVPAILCDLKTMKVIEQATKNISNVKNQLKEKIGKILKDPDSNDCVFNSLQKLFQNESAVNLNRDKKIYSEIVELAEQRFKLGYPPRKESDNSIGDAFHWEWIIKCAENSKKDIIIVTRDFDFGRNYDKDFHLNDWLKQEFKQRISQKRKIHLTDKLTAAFQRLDSSVTNDMIEEEKNIIESYHYNSSMDSLRQNLGMLNNTIYNNGLTDSMRQTLEMFHNTSFIPALPLIEPILQSKKNINNIFFVKKNNEDESE